MNKVPISLATPLEERSVFNIRDYHGIIGSRLPTMMLSPMIQQQERVEFKLVGDSDCLQEVHRIKNFSLLLMKLHT